MSYAFSTGRELIALCEKENLTIAEVMIRREAETSEKTRDELVNEMFENLLTMQKSIRFGLEENQQTVTGLAGGNAEKLMAYAEKANMGRDMAQICAAALAVAEVNASMGRIVAAPTAGASGVLPAVLVMCSEKHGFTDRDLVNGLFTAGAVGVIIARNASISGAEGGCQAEVGAASAMAASAAVELFGGTPAQCLDAASFAIVNILGLVCDPIGGLVENPCQNRNAMGASNALISAELSMAGIKSITPIDETIGVMYAVGRSIPSELRETSMGGMAVAKSACEACAACAKETQK